MTARRSCVYLAAATVAAPLILIAAAIALAPWFTPLHNALSDLGNEARHPDTAKVYNFAMALGGLLLAITACRCVRGWRGPVLWSEAFTLTLVGVFNEAYGRIHFIVSVLFFLSLLALLVGYAATSRGLLRAYAAAGIAAYAVMWYLHFAHHTPPGAAVPELASVAIYAPLLLHAAYTGGASTLPQTVEAEGSGSKT